MQFIIHVPIFGEKIQQPWLINEEKPQINYWCFIIIFFFYLNLIEGKKTFINIFRVLNIHWASVMQLETTFIISVWIRCVDNFKIHCSTFVFADMKSRLTQMILWPIKTSRTGFTAAMTQWQINYYRDTQTCPNSLCQRTRQSPHSTSEI